VVPKQQFGSVRQPVHSDYAVHRERWKRQLDRIDIGAIGEQPRHFDFVKRDVMMTL
jgi:hypothetical protein